MIPVKVIGVGLSPDDITVRQDELIRNADILIGGKSQLEIYKDLNVKKITIKNNLSAIVETVLESIDTKNIVVLASGDPLFHSIGSYLIQQIGEARVEILPNISSVSKAFAKIKLPWHDARLISLHGNKPENISLVLQKPRTNEQKLFCLLTDKAKDPVWIAEKLIAEKEINFTMCVLEKLDTIDEKITWFDDLLKIPEQTFAHPNIVILKKESPSQDFTCNTQIFGGMNDDNFLYENGLITKSEIRCIALSKLNFDRPDYIFWDFGAGSGAVSIEASAFLPHGKIFAVEKNKERISIINKNISTFNIKNINVIQSELPAGIEKLPNPDRIFIGGGGKGLTNIAEKAIQKLSINGIIVINTVLIQNLEPVVSLMKNLDINPQVLSVQISKSKAMPFGDRFEPLNPVWIIHGKKEK